MSKMCKDCEHRTEIKMLISDHESYVFGECDMLPGMLGNADALYKSNCEKEKEYYKRIMEMDERAYEEGIK